MRWTSASTVEIPGNDVSAALHASGFDERVERRQVDRRGGWQRLRKRERDQPSAPEAVRALEQTSGTRPPARALQEGAGSRTVHTGGMTPRTELLDDGDGLPRLERMVDRLPVGGGVGMWIRRPELRNHARDPVEKRLSAAANGVVFDACDILEHVPGDFRAA